MKNIVFLHWNLIKFGTLFMVGTQSIWYKAAFTPENECILINVQVKFEPIYWFAMFFAASLTCLVKSIEKLVVVRGK